MRLNQRMQRMTKLKNGKHKESKLDEEKKEDVNTDEKRKVMKRRRKHYQMTKQR